MSDFQITLACFGFLLCLAALVGATFAVIHDLGAVNDRLQAQLDRLTDRQEIRP